MKMKTLSPCSLSSRCSPNRNEQLALMLFEEEAMAMSPSYADFATKSLTSSQDRQAALTKLALDTELVAPMQVTSLIDYVPIASTSQSPPGVTPLSDEEYEINKKRILKEIDEEMARAERKKRRQSEASRRRRNRNALATGSAAGRCNLVLCLVTCVLSCYQTSIDLSGIRDVICKNFGRGDSHNLYLYIHSV
jgi:hypothetical protein